MTTARRSIERGRNMRVTRSASRTILSITLLAVAALVSAGTPPPVLAGTGTCVGVVATATGPTSTILSWGSGKIPLTVKTNAAKGYKLTVTVTGVKNGIVIGVKDINITLATSASTGANTSMPPVGTASATKRTSAMGDQITVKLSTWQPMGSPTVALRYVLTPYPGATCP